MNSNELLIQTDQNLELNLPIAGLGERVAATLIDSVILSFCYLAIFIILELGTSFLGLSSPGTIFYLLLFLPLFVYHLLFEILFDGQTLGKKWIGIKVVSLNGSSVPIISYFLRWLIRLIDVTISFGGIATFFIAYLGKGQRIGDIAAGTAVIRLEPYKNYSTSPQIENLFENSSKQSSETHEISFPTARRLSLTDIKLIQEGLQRHENRPDDKLIEMLTNKIENIIGAEASISPALFLQTILKDYFALQRD